MDIVAEPTTAGKVSAPYIGFCPKIEWPYVIEDWHVHPYQPQLIVSVCIYCSEETGDITWHAQPALEARQ
jgi:hypothetical protein